jgi:hypothetical protein
MSNEHKEQLSIHPRSHKNGSGKIVSTSRPRRARVVTVGMERHSAEHPHDGMHAARVAKIRSGRA